MTRLSFLLLALGPFILKLDFSQASSRAPLILGGQNAKIKDYPYQVSITLPSDNTFCGGSILKEDVILTAAHCTLGEDPKIMKVRAGSNYRNKKGQVRKVSKIHVHPKYDNADADYDVSIVLLKNPFKFTNKNNIRKIKLASTLVPDNTYANVTGWGSLKGGGYPKKLQVVSVPKINQKLCVKLWKPEELKVTPRMTCYGNKDSLKDACPGDSGGPLVANKKQVGIVSWGDDCTEPGLPGVYTNVFNKEIIEFIKEFI